MKTLEKRFARRLDRLSGTYPNDERTSRINEKGFALCGLFYMCALAVRILNTLLFRDPYVYSFSDRFFRDWRYKWWDRAILGVMVLIMLCITVKQRRREEPVQNKKHVKLRLTELPRAAAALLSGKSPEDERTVRAFERGFAVCALLGFAYFGISIPLSLWGCRYYISNFLLMCAAPLLVGVVKYRQRILTPPRAAHIRLSIKHVLLRIPVYALVVLPFFLIVNFIPVTYGSIGRIGPDHHPYSENMFLMFFQCLGDACKAWLHDPWHISRTGLLYFALFYLIIMLFHEITVTIYRRQMQQMDAEENDLS